MGVQSVDGVVEDLQHVAVEEDVDAVEEEDHMAVTTTDTTTTVTTPMVVGIAATTRQGILDLVGMPVVTITFNKVNRQVATTAAMVEVTVQIKDKVVVVDGTVEVVTDTNHIRWFSKQINIGIINSRCRPTTRKHLCT